MRVAVLDMQPIEPAMGGGRIRLLGLYHALGHETLYVGTFDWPGERARTLALTPTLTEVDVPLSAAHFSEDRRWRELADGVNVIDTAFPILGRLSADYVRTAREAVAAADVVVISHPWIYPLVADALDRARQVLVYDAHNVESLLRWELLGDRPFNREIAKGVVVTETTLARAADLVLACSEDDARFFAEACGVGPGRLHRAPNGVFAERIVPTDRTGHEAARARLGLRGTVAIFLGSQYGPNVEAVRFMAEVLCPRFPQVTFAACGGVGHDPSAIPARPPNLLLPGLLSEEEKLAWLQAADLAVNPMFAGSGTNIKMFDFMAAALGVLATPMGARGIAERTRGGIVVAGRERFPSALAELLADPARVRSMGRANRAWVQADFSWERISPALGARLAEAAASKAAGQAAAAAALARSAPRPRRPAPGEGPVVIMSSWRMACGIAGYAENLTRALEAHGVPVLILGNHETDPGHLEPASPGSPLGAPVRRLWHWDNLRWVNSRIDFDGLRQTLEEIGARAFNVQYHQAFYREAWLVDVVRIARQLGLPVTVTVHNSNRLGADTADALAALGAVMLVHKRDEAERLARVHPGAVRRLLMGVRNVPHARGRPRADGPVIGTFGFLRPYKGLKELLAAMPIIRGAFPGARLVARCALYPAEDSRKYLDEVLALIDALGLGECIDLDTRFADLDETVDALAATDVIVLPYAASDEGASASLTTVMAACRPIVVARSSIFDDVADDVYVADGNEPEVIAAAVATVLANGDLQAELEARVRAELERCDWMNVAIDFLEAFDATAEAAGR